MTMLKVLCAQVETQDRHSHHTRHATLVELHGPCPCLYIEGNMQSSRWICCQYFSVPKNVSMPAQFVPRCDPENLKKKFHRIHRQTPASRSLATVNDTVSVLQGEKGQVCRVCLCSVRPMVHNTSHQLLGKVAHIPKASLELCCIRGTQLVLKPRPSPPVESNQTVHDRAGEAAGGRLSALQTDGRNECHIVPH